MLNVLCMRDWNIDNELFKYYPQCTYLDVGNSNSPLLRLLVNGSAIFSFWMEKLNIHCYLLNVVLNEMVTQVFVICPLEYLFFLQQKNCSNTINMQGNEVFDNNPQRNKIAWTNSIYQHISTIDKYSASLTYTLNIFSLCICHTITTPLVRPIYPITVVWVLLSTA